MALLKINGVPVQATASEWEPVTLGEMARSLNGAPRSTARVRKANLRYTSGLLSVPEAQLLRALVDGEGHVLSFEDTASPSAYLYTSRDVGPSDSGGASRSTSDKKWGTASLLVPANMTAAWDFGTAYSGQVTVIGWLHPPGGEWEHYITTPTNTYLNGEPYGNPESQFWSLYAGTLRLGDLENHDLPFRFDDVVTLPFAVPDAWVPDLYAFHATQAWPALPHVLAEDPRLPAGGLLCLGEVGASQALPRRTSVGERVEFTLYGT